MDPSSVNPEWQKYFNQNTEVTEETNEDTGDYQLSAKVVDLIKKYRNFGYQKADVYPIKFGLEEGNKQEILIKEKMFSE